MKLLEFLAILRGSESFSSFGAPLPMREETGRGRMSSDQQRNCQEINSFIPTCTPYQCVNHRILMVEFAEVFERQNEQKHTENLYLLPVSHQFRLRGLFRADCLLTSIMKQIPPT